jgi:SAM-dependent methyltransferase
MAELTWSDYYRATAGRQPRELFVRAFKLSQADGGSGRLAIDLGCGDGTETLLMLASGWRVLAVDQEQTALELLFTRAPESDRSRLSVQAMSFQSLELPTSDFLYAGFSIFFCPPDDFPQLWRKVAAAIRPGGRVAAHFLGKRDSWATNADMTSHDPESVRQLFGGFTIEGFVEVEHDRPAVSGPKHWHLFEVVACKS